MDTKKSLIELCRLWYLTRQATQGDMVEENTVMALKAFDKKVQDICDRHNIM